MQWTENEIRRMYRFAKHPDMQVEILAQLNACSIEKIRGILGLPGSGQQKGAPERKTRSTRLRSIYTVQLEEFYFSGREEAVLTYKDAQEARRAQVAMVTRRNRFSLAGVKITKQGNTIILRKEPGEGC